GVQAFGVVELRVLTPGKADDTHTVLKGTDKYVIADYGPFVHLVPPCGNFVPGEKRSFTIGLANPSENASRERQKPTSADLGNYISLEKSCQRTGFRALSATPRPKKS